MSYHEYVLACAIGPDSSTYVRTYVNGPAGRALVLGHFGSVIRIKTLQRVIRIIALHQNTVNDIVPVFVEDSAVLRAPPTDSTIPPVDPVNGIDRKLGWIPLVAVDL